MKALLLVVLSATAAFGVNERIETQRACRAGCDPAIYNDKLYILSSGGWVYAIE